MTYTFESHITLRERLMAEMNTARGRVKHLKLIQGQICTLAIRLDTAKLNVAYFVQLQQYHTLHLDEGTKLDEYILSLRRITARMVELDRELVAEIKTRKEEAASLEADIAQVNVMWQEEKRCQKITRGRKKARMERRVRKLKRRLRETNELDDRRLLEDMSAISISGSASTQNGGIRRAV